MNKQYFLKFFLIFLAIFLLFPNFTFGENFEEITPEKIEKYLQLPEKNAVKLLDSLIQAFTTEWMYLQTEREWTSRPATEEEKLVPLVLRKAVRIHVLNHLLIDAPIEITWKIVKNGVDIARLLLIKDPKVLLEELERESVKKATEYGMSVLLQNEIRATPGVIKFRYLSNKGWQEVDIQHIMIYRPLSSKRGQVSIRFYSPNYVEPPTSQGSFGVLRGTPHSVQGKLPPFIAEITGKVEKGDFDKYYWIDEEGNRFVKTASEPEPVRPSIKISFPGSVPDLGIRPLGFWERHIWKPIVAQFKEVEVIITKVTGKAPKIVETILNLPQVVENTWNRIKSTISKFNPFGAGVGQQVVSSPIAENTEARPPQITEPVQEKKESTPAGESTELRPVSISEKEKEEIKKKELQKRVDDLLEQIDLVQAKIDRLTKEKEAQKIAEKAEKNPKELKREKKKEEEKISKEQNRSLVPPPQPPPQPQNQPPTASFTFSPQNPFLGDTILQVQDNQGATSLPAFKTLKIAEKPTLSVVINEITWMGTKASDNDEWIELHNTTKNPIDLTGWKLISLTDNSPNITLSGTIPPLGFYLLERTNDDTVKDILADWKGSFGRGGLKNDGEELELRDSQNNLVDKINCQKDEAGKCKSWFAGKNEKDKNNKWIRISMERINPRVSGQDSSNWADNNGQIINGLDAKDQPINGTPRAQNSVYKSLPPNAVENFAIDYQNSSGNKVVLTWSPATDLDTPSEKLSYEIYYSKDEEIGESNWQKAIQSTKIPEIDSESGKLTITISDLDYNSTYYFGIRAFDGQNYSSLSTISQPYQTATLSTIATNFSDSDLNINYFKNNGRKIVRASNGDLYVVYSRAGKIFLAKSEDKGMTWRTIPVSEEGLTDQINPSIAIDSQNNIHIVWQGKVDTSTPYQIRYAKYDGNSFSIKTLTKNKAENQEIPVIAVDSRDNVHIVWLDRGTKKIFHWRLSVKREISLSAVDTEFKIENFNYETLPFFFSLAIDRQDQIHLVWHGTFSIGPSWHYITQYRKKFPNGEWGEIKTLNFYEQVGDLPSLVVDSQDNVHIVWHSIASTGASKINYLKYTDSTSTIEILDQKKRSNMMVIASPSIALDSQDHLYVIWKRWNEKISLKEYLNSWAEKKNLELGSLNSFAFTNLLWSFYPVNTNQPKTGYAFIFYQGTDQGTNLKFYASQDLGWE